MVVYELTESPLYHSYTNSIIRLHSSGVSLQQTKEKIEYNIEMQLFFLKSVLSLKYRMFHKEKSIAFRLPIKQEAESFYYPINYSIIQFLQFDSMDYIHHQSERERDNISVPFSYFLGYSLSYMHIFQGCKGGNFH